MTLRSLTIVPLLLSLLILTWQHARAQTPAMQVELTSAGPQAEAALQMRSPVTRTDTSKWNSVRFSLPEDFDLGPRSCLSVQGRITSDTSPDYVGLNVKSSDGQEAFASITPRDDQSFSFSLSLDRFKAGSPSGPASRLTDQAPARPSAYILIYPRFSQPTLSRLDIESLRITSSRSAAPCESLQQTNQALLQGQFDMLPIWHGTHPRLYTGRAELDAMAEAYRQDPRPFEQALPHRRQMSGSPIPLDRGHTAQGSAMALARIAMAYRLTGERRYLDRLREWIPVLNDYRPSAMDHLGSTMGLTAGHILLGFSLSYDVLAGSVDEDVIQAVRGVLVRQGDQTFRDLSRLGNFPYEQNHLIIPVAALGVAALALADEGETFRRWGVFSTNVMSRSLASIAHDGWFFEGMSYWDYTMQFPTAYAAATQRLVGGTPFLKPPFRHLAEYVSHMTLPRPDFVFDFGDWGPRVEADGTGFQRGYDKPWHTQESTIRPFVLYLTWREGGRHPLLAHYLTRLMQGERYAKTLSDIDSIFWMMLGLGNRFREMDPQGMDRFPPYHHFNDMDVLHWRSNWNDPDATAIAFKAGPPAGHNFLDHLRRYPDSRPSLGHAHPDAGSFIIYSRGAFLANDTGYTGKKETADHNALLIDGVGQALGGTAWSTFTDRPYAAYDAIRLTNVWLGPKVAAATAILDAAYPASLKMSSIRRDWILVDSRFLVISDELASEVPHRYAWRLHTDNRPAVMEGRGYSMVNGEARLSIFPLAGAASAQIRPTVVETELFDTRRSRPQQRGHHLELSSGITPSHRFLTALIVGSSNADEKAISASLEPDGSVVLTDEEGSCQIWLQSSTKPDSAFAYQLRSREGMLQSSGSSGSAPRHKTNSPEISSFIQLH